MHYFKLPHMDSAVSIFDIAQAHAQLESDYNREGMLWERPSNRRRNASTGVQLHRMGFANMFDWVEILSDDEEGNDVRDIYLVNVLKYGLPMDAEMRSFIGQRYTPEFLLTFPHWSKA